MGGGVLGSLQLVAGVRGGGGQLRGALSTIVLAQALTPCVSAAPCLKG